MAFDIKALRQQKADLVRKNSALLAAAEAANRDLTEAENTEYDASTASISSLNSRIARVEAQMDQERNLPASSAIQVGHNLAEDKPWSSLAEQLQAIKLQATSKGAQTDPRLHADAIGGNESIDSEGGFLIAPEFAPGVWQRTYEVSELAQRCFDQPMTTSNRLVVNAVDEDSRADGSRWGGVLSYWLGESGTLTPTQPKFRQMELNAKKLIVLSYATDEQLVDGPAWAAYVDKVVPLELAFQVDNTIYNGTGAGQPLGFMNSGSLLTLAKDSGDAGGTKTFNANDVFNMWERCWAPARKNACWFINQDTESNLWNLTRGSGTAVELLYTGPGERGNASSYGVMFGRPVIPVEYAATQGTPGDIVLADLQQYCLARRSGVQMDTSIHVQFLTDQMAFRWKTRLDGQPYWKKPLTPKNGTNTYSPFVALAARS